jgi:hypothetical protein
MFVSTVESLKAGTTERDVITGSKNLGMRTTCELRGIYVTWNSWNFKADIL